MMVLVETLVHRQTQLTREPFEPVTVVVQSFGMGQWLKLKLAESQGIAANIDCILPANLIWRLYQAFLDTEELPDASPFDRALLTWRLMQILPGMESAEYDQVQQYLHGAGDPQIRLYQLCHQIAGLFDQYLVYRPHWMLGWQQGENPVSKQAMRGQEWQIDLWQALLNQPGMAANQNRAQLHNALQNRIETSHEAPATVPRHVSVFGLSSLPPMHLDTLRMLGHLIDVDIYFLNPCEHYWGDIVSNRDMARRTIRQVRDKAGPLEDEDYLEVGNPLLASMGKQGREFLEMLLSIDEAASEEAFVPANEGTMLGYTKNDILHMEFGGQFASNAPPERQSVKPDDRSIQIHSCHNKMREVEVLYDRLQRIFAENDEIKPRHVMVMMPNVADYAPYIHAVFNDKLPYAVTDITSGEESLIVASFTKLLNLPTSRLTAAEVMDFLEVPAIARRFDLEDDDLVILAQRIQESGIRFEIDGSSKEAKWNLPPSNQNTWSFGLQRLLAGYAMESTHGLYGDILPVDLEGSESHLIGVLCHIVDSLAHYRERLDTPGSPDDWLARVNELLQDFYAPQGDEELELDGIRSAVQSLLENSYETGFDDNVSPDLFRYWMTMQLHNPGHIRGFLTGGVTFATLVPMRSIPFSTICLLGMNDTEYPRQAPTPGFDLMELEGPLKGDRSRRNDDRYLFLEALVSAEQFFYVSYAGKSVKDNSDKVPSVLVSELMDYCQAVFGTDSLTEHPLQPFSSTYFDKEATELFTYHAGWYRALTNTQAKQPFIPGPLARLDPPAAVDIEELTQFYRHPARYFLRQRLGVYFKDADDVELKESESFRLNPLEQYQIADSALAHLMEGVPQEDWQTLTMASGVVMDNAVGMTQLANEFDKAREVFGKISDYVHNEARTLSGTMTLNGYKVQGQVDNIYGDILLDYRTGKLRHRQLLQAWIRHLFLNAAHHQTRCLLVSTDKTETWLSSFDAQWAQEQLASLVEYFYKGLEQPLPLIPEMSFQYANALEKGESVAAARKRALNTWFDDQDSAEGKDRNYSRCFEFPDAFDQTPFHDVAMDIAVPIVRSLTT